MFLRTDDVIEMAKTFYTVIAVLGRGLQLLALAFYRKSIGRLLVDIQKFVNRSNSAIVSLFSTRYVIL